MAKQPRYEIEYLEWSSYWTYADLLCDAIRKHARAHKIRRFHHVIGIPKGGTVIADFIGRALDIEVGAWRVRRYRKTRTGIVVGGRVEAARYVTVVFERPQPKVLWVIVVEDLNDKGDTLEYIAKNFVAALRRSGCRSRVINFIIVSPLQKVTASAKPDISIREIEINPRTRACNWIDFPNERAARLYREKRGLETNSEK